MTNSKLNLVFLGTIAIIFIVVTYIVSLQNYLLFHALVEGLSIFISFTVFVIAWNSRSYLEDNYLLVIGLAYFFIGFLDFMHTLSYKGMNIFTNYDFYANQLWIAARFFESVVLLFGLSIVGGKRVIKPYIVFTIYMFITTSVIITIFFTDIFPVCFVEGEGQTVFKLISEYVIIALLGCSVIIVRKKRSLFDKTIYHLLIISIILTMLSELAFTFYISNYGFSNLVGHYLKIISFYCIYQAIVVTGIQRPYALIFKELSDVNEEMKMLNRQLEESIEESIQANQSKSKYLSVISHEMRTPLNGILGFTQMLKRSEPNKEQEEYINEIVYSANILRQSIDNILDIEKFRTDKMQYSEEVIKLAGFFKERLFFYRVLCDDKRLIFEHNINVTEGMKVIVDQMKLEQLFNNLLSNAVKFTEKGKVSLEVSAKTTDGEVVLEFKVTDTGEGITRTDQEDLFKPFVQVGNQKKTKYGGSGLGLSICKEIVKHYKGDIRVESTINEGAVFRGVMYLKLGTS